MKRIVVFFTLILFAALTYADTIDYWQVAINDSLIARYNDHSKDLSYHISRSAIKPGDLITIRHGDDTPSPGLRHMLMVRDDRNRTIKITETKEHYGNLTMSLYHLDKSLQGTGSRRLDFYYYEQDENGNSTAMKLVFQLTVR